eukprot:Nk52_evm36s1810 gene=Nk52_evmTU36s1810
MDSEYNNPYAQMKGVKPITHTQSPIVTGTSILAVKCTDGVVMAADTLGSYGSMARFRGVSRLHKVNSTTVLGAGGDYADFQCLKDMLDELVIADECIEDGYQLSPQSIYHYLSRVMYNRRSKMDPLWNQLVIAGYKDQKALLGFVDKIGVMFEAPYIATGFGAHLALPLIRKACEGSGGISVEQGKILLEDCLRVLFYRDARSLNKYEIGVISSAGVTISEPKSAQTNWEIGTMFTGFE